MVDFTADPKTGVYVKHTKSNLTLNNENFANSAKFH